MLRIYRGIAAKNYENTFFREFAENLSQLFEKYKIDGLLIGNPECTVEGRLQIDALLITNNAVCIIDFKNFYGKIQLPRVADFLLGRWTNQSGEMVKGGSSINPYIQLKTQRKRFYDVFKENIESRLPHGNHFNPGHTIRVVCFQKEVEVIGSIPPKEEVNFKILHNGSYLEKIKDIIDVNDSSVNLTPVSYPVFLEFFEADKFELKESYGKAFDFSYDSSKLNVDGLREDQKTALNEFQSFLKDDNESAFILQGTSNSGKSHLIPFLKDLSFEAGISQVEILAPSSRIANNLVSWIDDIGSLYSYIYGGNQVSEHEENPDYELEGSDNDKIDIVPLKKSDNEDNCIFIVDESQLISDSYHQSLDLRFGSGYLLKDFIKFLNIENTNRKVVFIGDCYQISLGKANEYPLSHAYLSEKYKLSVRAFQLGDHPESNSILINSLNCVLGLRQDFFNQLKFEFGKNLQSIEKTEVSEIIRRHLHKSEEIKFLSYTNEEAHKVNLWIKRTILKNGEDLSEGDLLLLNNNIRVEELDNPFTKPQKLFNGQFFTVESSEAPYKEIVDLKGGNKVELVFRKIHVRLLGKNSKAKLLSLENYRTNPKTELSQDAVIAIKILLNRELAKLQKNKSYESSTICKTIVNSEEYRTLEQEVFELQKRFDSGESVKTKLDALERKLRVLSNRGKRNHRKDLEHELMSNPSSTYYQLKNLAFLRYGWALNVHKAMSYKWDNIVFNVDWNGGIANSVYFKWLYTGLTRAKVNSYLLNYQEINPMQKAEFKVSASNQNFKKDYFAVLSPDNTLTEADLELATRLNLKGSDYCALKVGLHGIIHSKIHSNGITVKSIEHPNYQQVYTFTDGSDEVKVRFYYDSKGRVKSPTVQSGINDSLNHTIMQMLTTDRAIQDYSFIKDAWRRDIYQNIGIMLSAKGCFIQSIIQTAYKDSVCIAGNEGEWLDVDVNYNGDGFFTSIIAKQYSDEKVWQNFKHLMESYDGE